MLRQVIRNFGTCLKFNGTSDVVTVTNVAALRLTSAWTVAAWVKFTSRPNGTGVISTAYSAGSVMYELGFGFEEGGGGTSKLKVGFYTGAAWAICADTLDIGLTHKNQWMHIAGTWDGTTLKLYKDGTLINTNVPGVSDVSSTNSIYLGRRHDAAGSVNFFPGYIDDPIIIDTALTAAQIETLFTGAVPTPTGTVSRWLFDEGSGTTANDAVSTNHGTITGATYSSDVVMVNRSVLGPAVCTFLQNTSDLTTQTTYTFAAQNLGTASAERYIICSIVTRKAGTGGAINTVTIGGISATIVGQVTGTSDGNSMVTGIAIAVVPTGTTGTVVVTLNVAHLRCGIALYAATSVGTAAVSEVLTSTATDPTVTLDIPAGGFAVGVAGMGASTSATWTGLTETYDDPFQAFCTQSGGALTFAAAQTNLAITCDFAGAAAASGVFASWAGKVRIAV